MSHKLEILGDCNGLDPNMPTSSIILNAYFLWDKEIPLELQAISRPKNTSNSQRFLVWDVY